MKPRAMPKSTVYAGDGHVAGAESITAGEQNLSEMK